MEEPVEVYETLEVKQGEFLNRFIKKNLEGVIDGYDRIVSTAMDTVSQFTLVKGNEVKYTKIGLAFGRVQSGKTTYFHCVSACAFDNDYDIVIILSGVTKNLLNQNIKRLKYSFRECRDILEFKESSDFENDMSKHIDDIRDYFYSYKNRDRGVFISVLKDSSHLQKIKSIADAFVDKRIMVIDDEGDQFSLNTKINKGENQESSTFSKIKSIINTSDNLSFLSVTATPQANVFIEIYNDLSPEFVILVEPGESYCGLETFHSNSEYIAHVSGSKASFARDLREALIYYLFTVYETEINNSDQFIGKKNWMMIHNSRRIIKHINDFTELKDILDYDLKPMRNFNFDGKIDISKQKIINAISLAYEKHNISNKFGFSLRDFLSSFNKVLSAVYSNDKSIKIVNSKSSENYRKLQETKCGILIGGDMLGRGITVKGLTVSYLTRSTISGKGNVEQGGLDIGQII